MRADILELEMPGCREPRIETGPGLELPDPRFRALMAEADWASLPPTIRRRFSKRHANGKTAVYAGEVLETRMSGVGWCLAQAARLIGGPLPLTRNIHVPVLGDGSNRCRIRRDIERRLTGPFRRTHFVIVWHLGPKRE